jgi:hypothetical protein
MLRSALTGSGRGKALPDVGIAIDTLAFARRLREAGFSEQQAEGQARALAETMTDTLATKQDLREMDERSNVRFTQIDQRFASIDARFEFLERHLDVKLEEFEKRMEIRLAEKASRADLLELEHRMTVRLGTITVASIGVVSALVRIL